MWKSSVLLLFSSAFLNNFIDTDCNYFFDKSEVAGLSQQQWITKCDNILTETRLHQVIFNIKGLCSQLRCLRDNNLKIYMGFDYCMRTATRCIYPEPDYTLPFPECCPRRQCGGLKSKIFDYKTFIKRKGNLRRVGGRTGKTTRV